MGLSPPTVIRATLYPNITVTTQLSETTITAGQSAFDTAQVSGTNSIGFGAVGTVAYTVYNNVADCVNQTNGTPAGTELVSGGLAANSDTIPFSNVGTYVWQAIYTSSDGTTTASNACGSEVLTVAATANPGPFPTSFTLNFKGYESGFGLPYLNGYLGADVTITGVQAQAPTCVQTAPYCGYMITQVTGTDFGYNQSDYSHCELPASLGTTNGTIEESGDYVNGLALMQSGGVLEGYAMLYTLEDPSINGCYAGVWLSTPGPSQNLVIEPSFSQPLEVGTSISTWPVLYRQTDVSSFSGTITIHWTW